MSKIAEALAKAKERTGVTTIPLGDATHAPSPASARPARDKRLVWLCLLSLASLALVIIIWIRLTPAPAPAAPPSAPPPPAAEAPGPPAPPVAPEPRADLAKVVNGLVITAVLPGDRPRLMLGNRMIGQGEPVDPELMFAGVGEGHVLFRDARGTTYSRKY